MREPRKRKTPQAKRSERAARNIAPAPPELSPDDLMNLVRKSAKAVAELDRTLKHVFELTAAQAVLRIK